MATHTPLQRIRKFCSRRAQRVVAVTSCIITILTLVLFNYGSPAGTYNAQSATYTFNRGRLKPLGNYSLPTRSGIPITWNTLNSLLPRDVNLVSFPGATHECLPSQILKVIETYEDFHRFSACPRVMYNRVPKCGSRTILSVFKELGLQNNFSVHSEPKPEGHNYFTRLQQMVDFGMNFSLFREPFLYSQHLHFVNFSQLGVSPPMYINVIRDPVDRVISHFYYNKYGSGSEVKEFRHNVSLDECVQSVSSCPFLPTHHVLPFFCGHPKACRVYNQDTLHRAKRTLRESFLVVGFTEDLSAFLEVLETLMPKFFYNASTVLSAMEDKLINRTQTVHKPPVLPRTASALRHLLAFEYQFYEYAKQRFYTLHNKLRSLKLDEQIGW